MYKGKAEYMKKMKQQEQKTQKLKKEIAINASKIKQIYGSFQENLNDFAKKHKHEITSDSKFRDKFSQMCQQFDVNPMLAEKSIWTGLGFGDFYHHLAMNILDICAKHRHQNGGIMKITDIISYYKRKEKSDISKNDVIRAMDKAYELGNISILDNQYVCTVPLQMNTSLTELLTIAEKFGFISAKLLKKQKNWSQDDFENRIKDLRRKGIIWVDKKSNGQNNPHYYFLSHLGTDFQQFASFMKQY